jgi:hypothetical protein
MTPGWVRGRGLPAGTALPAVTRCCHPSPRAGRAIRSPCAANLRPNWQGGVSVQSIGKAMARARGYCCSGALTFYMRESQRRIPGQRGASSTEGFRLCSNLVSGVVGVFLHYLRADWSGIIRFILAGFSQLALSESERTQSGERRSTG